MADLSKVDLQRQNSKQKLVRFQEFFNSIQKDDNIINQLQIRLEKLNPVWEEFNNIQFEIEQAGKDGSKGVDDRVRTEFENLYFDLIGNVQALCAEYTNTNNKVG